MRFDPRETLRLREDGNVISREKLMKELLDQLGPSVLRQLDEHIAAIRKCQDFIAPQLCHEIDGEMGVGAAV